MYRTITLLVLLLLTVTAAGTAAAQGNEWILVPIRTLAVEQPEGVDVEVYFSLRDLQGRVVTRQTAGLDQTGTVLMRTGPAGAPQPATISEPNTPISIILLIDSSGSMANAMSSVIAAAQRAVDQAPANAVFSVFNFNNVQLDQAFNPMIAQSADRAQVKNVIGSIQAQRGGITCMYNAAYKVLEHPSVQVSSAFPRSALIVFTDGKDDNGQGGRCSSITESGLIGQARKYLTQLHTIGLCTDGACSNVDRVGLETLARDSSGFSAFGELNAISNSFDEIMAAINSQFVARVRVLAAKGDNLGRLEVTTRNQSLPISGDFVFASTRDYFLNPVFSLARRYDAATNSYQIGVVIDNPQTVGRVTISVIDKQAGTVIGDEIVLDVPPGSSGQTQLTTVLQADALVSGSEYCFQLRAIGASGQPIVTQGQTGGGVQSVLTEQCGQHTQIISFEIAEIIPNYEAGKLIIRLNVTGTRPDLANINGEILDEDEVQIVRIDPQLPDADGTISLAMPDALLRQSPADFTLRLILTGGDEPLVATRKFRHQPPEQPLPIFPIIAVVSGALLMLIALVYARRKPKVKHELQGPQYGGGTSIRTDAAPGVANTPPPPPAAAPPQEVTHMYVPSKAEQLSGPLPGLVQRARIRFLRSPSGELQPERIITSFPCTIGRAGIVTISGDNQVSREHLELSLLNGVLYAVDHNSTHGTIINGQRLAVRTPTAVTQATRVMLGPNTEIEITPVSG